MDHFPLSDALKYVRCGKSVPDEEFILYPKERVETKRGEVYWRESAAEHDALMDLLGISPVRHTAVWESVSLAVENAFLRGNQASQTLDVIVRVYKGITGQVVQVIDHGSGFDYKRLVNRVHAGEKYQTGTGKGLRVINDAPVVAGFEGAGNIMNIAILYEKII